MTDPASLTPQQKRPQILLGTFIHSKSRRQLEYLHHAAVAVDGQGMICAVVQSREGVEDPREEVLKVMGWTDKEEEEVDVVQCREGEFFFPGFIGMSSTSCLSSGGRSRLFLWNWVSRVCVIN